MGTYNSLIDYIEHSHGTCDTGTCPAARSIEAGESVMDIIKSLEVTEGSDWRDRYSNWVWSYKIPDIGRTPYFTPDSDKYLIINTNDPLIAFCIRFGLDLTMYEDYSFAKIHGRVLSPGSSLLIKTERVRSILNNVIKLLKRKDFKHLKVNISFVENTISGFMDYEPILLKLFLK